MLSTLSRSVTHTCAALSLAAGLATGQTKPKVIFLGASQTSGADGAILTFLQNRYGKANVTFQSTEPVGTVTRSTVLGYDVAVLSSTPSSGRYRNILHDSPTPIVNFEEAMAGNNGGEYSITAGRTKETETGAHAIKIGAAHPITAGFTLNQTVTITTGPAEVWWSTGTQASGAKSLAADDDAPANMFLTYVDVGDQLINPARKAECRRVMFGMTDNTFSFFSADGKKLFGQAIDWAAEGCCAQWNNYGVGVAGKNGIPSLRLTAPPRYSATVNIIGTNSSGAPTAALLIYSKQQVSVSVFGGTLLVSPTVVVAAVLPATGFTVPWAIPDGNALCGRVPRDFHTSYFQLVQLDSAAPAGWSFTPGLRVEHGK